MLDALLGDEAADITFTVVIIETAEQLWTFTSKNFGAELAIKAGLSMADTLPTPEEADCHTGLEMQGRVSTLPCTIKFSLLNPLF